MRSLEERLEALGSPVMAEALRGEIPLRFTARRSSDIVSALKLSSEYGFLLIIDDAGEAYRNASDIARAKVPV